ncbi:hypothetical protein TNCV_2053041 [Trichonephila clavipes]|nr:hypothetical protein TNCV_2053041 [Trichonephila clavipes]
MPSPGFEPRPYGTAVSVTNGRTLNRELTSSYPRTGGNSQIGETLLFSTVDHAKSTDYASKARDWLFIHHSLCLGSRDWVLELMSYPVTARESAENNSNLAVLHEIGSCFRRETSMWITLNRLPKQSSGPMVLTNLSPLWTRHYHHHW